MKWAPAVGVVLPALVLVGCGSPPPAVTPVATTSSAPASSASGDPRNPLPLGATFTLTDPGLRVEATVFAVNQNIVPDSPAPPSGGHWAGADVQVCVREAHNDFIVGWDSWSVADADYGHYPQGAATLQEFPSPEFPAAPQPLAVGQCARGWVVFAVAVGVEVTLVKYKPIRGRAAFWSAATP